MGASFWRRRAAYTERCEQPGHSTGGRTGSSSSGCGAAAMTGAGGSAARRRGEGRRARKGSSAANTMSWSSSPLAGMACLPITGSPSALICSSMNGSSSSTTATRDTCWYSLATLA